jgi:16S rRNA (cytosine1402-N4)-methyltransferase
MKSKYHESVMVREAVDALHIKKARKPACAGRYIDATVGNAGHTSEILKEGGRVLGIDLDPKMLEIAKEKLKNVGNYKLVQGNFINIDRIVEENAWKPVWGILFDLGVTNVHLKDLERGFSFENPQSPLDMRIDPSSQGVTAADLLNALREDQLRDLFEVTLEKGAAKWIAGRVAHFRNEKQIATVGDMLEITKGLKVGKWGLSEATLPFLALRIAVNSELDNLEEALPKAFDLLEKGGRLVVISFHSKEDCVVKNFMRERQKLGARVLTIKPIGAGEEEISINRRARSAKMRVLEK